MIESAERIDLEEIRIDGPDGRCIRADLRALHSEGARPLVIVCHGFLGYKRWGFFPYLSDRIAAAGFHVLTVSFSMSGVDEATGRIERPGDFAADTVSKEIEDLESVCRFARRGALPRPVAPGGWGFVAHSRGSAVVLLAAGDIPEAASIVTWATPSTLDRYSERRKRLWKRDGALVFGDPRAEGPLRLDYAYYEDIERHAEEFDLPRAAASLEIPHLMIHGERDAAVTVGEMRKLYPGGAPGPARVEIIPGCSHTFGVRHPMGRPPKPLERAVGLTVDWLGSSLKEERTRL
ncbi:MAG TPA: alpha/beta fold hydrolase [Candidatus Eisenbacteria bacterium]|uniref:Alpha/beta fold hydrolase n=1 Tax=Eiseniibacteriota bacterium TaxID=2212470 RepID=A0A7V2F419_UNCEI|nr:alpha/beta fold hydrolase [Candidatus Eisenbacteria bacterium]